MKYWILSVFVLFLGVCSIFVEWVLLDFIIDLSGVWNDIDFCLVVEEMIQDVLFCFWILDFSGCIGK